MEDILSPQLTDPCSEQRETLSHKRKDDLAKDINPTPRVLRRSSTRNSPSCAEEKFPLSDLGPALRQISFVFHVLVLEGKIPVCACSRSPSEAMLWIKEVETVDTIDVLKSSRSV